LSHFQQTFGTNFQAIVLKLRERYTLIELSSMTGLDYSSISRIGSGKTDKVQYDVGVVLMTEYNKIIKKESRKK
jgi:hypothetical protein